MLQQNLIVVRTDINSLEKENEHIRNLIHHYRKSPRKIRQQAVERLLVAPKGSQVFRFPE